MRKKLGEILLASGVVTQADLDLALGDQMGGEPARLGDLLVSLGRLTPHQLARALSQQHSIPFVQLPPVPADVLGAVPLEFQVQHRLVPFRLTGDSMSVAMADPSNVDAIEELRASVNRKVVRYVASADEIEALHNGVSGVAVDMPVAPSVGRVAPGRGSSPTAQELFGSLDLEAPAPLGDDLFSGLDLPLPTTADVPPPPAVASVSPAPFELSASEASPQRDEEEPEFFEARPVVQVEPAPPPPPRIAPSPVPAAYELSDVALEGLESSGLTSSSSGTFDLTSAIEDETAARPPPAESSGSFEVSLSEASGDFAPAAPEEEAVTYEVVEEQSGDFGPPAAPAAESSGNFEVAFDEGSGDFGRAPAASADDFFAAAPAAPDATTGAFSTLEEEAVSFEELPLDSTPEPLPQAAEAFFAAPDTGEGELFSDAASTGADFFAEAHSGAELSTGDSLVGVDALIAGTPAPAAAELFGDAGAAADAFELPLVPQSGESSVLAMDEVVTEAPQAEPAPAVPQSLPSWLGPSGASAAATAPAVVLTPGEWTGRLDDVPPSRLIAGAVKALVLKGLVTEAEILEALAKKP
ncbi:MAG: hypothetical protein IAE78_15245 [Myxococcus sp.]|nr:hypothetical protein [Myxococcus sp.]